jgi:hypothetical protein
MPTGVGLRTRQGDTLQEGPSESKVAAQVAAQLAFERRQHAGSSQTRAAEQPCRRRNANRGVTQSLGIGST